MSHPTIDLLGPTPRPVPLPVRCHLMFGGANNQIAWGALAFAMIFFWAIVMNCEAVTWLTFPATPATTSGAVTNSYKTNVSEGGGKHTKGTPIYANDYQFTVNDKQYSGCSYALGRALASGQAVAIEYAPADPSVSRIQGYRVRMFSAMAVLVLIFPTVMLLMVLNGYLIGRKTRRLLECGQLAEGKLKSKEPKNTRINNKRVFKLTFEFTANDGRTYQAKSRTHHPEKLEDEATEQIIYDPADPTKCLLVDAMPGYFRVDETGNIQPESSRQALLVTMIPMLTICGNLAWAAMRDF